MHTRLHLRTLASLALPVGALLIAAAPAGAHTSLVASDPPSGAVARAVERIVLRFDGPVDPANVHVWIEDGLDVVELAPPMAVGDEQSAVAVAIPSMDDGSYALAWHVFAADGDSATGSVDFTIDASAAPADSPAANVPVAGITAGAGAALLALAALAARTPIARHVRVRAKEHVTR